MVSNVDAPGDVERILKSIGASLPGATTKTEQRYGIEEAAKKGQITPTEATQLTKQSIEGRELVLIRQQPQQQKEQQQITDIQAQREFLKSAGFLQPVELEVQKKLTPRDYTKYTSEADIRYVMLEGKPRLFVSPELIQQRRTPITELQKKITEKNVEVSNILKYKTPASVTNFLDVIDRRVQLSFKSKKPLNPFAFRNVAEAVYGIEKGAVKGIAEEPLTVGTSFVVGGALAKGAGILAAKAPILAKGIGKGAVTSKISAINVAGGVMAGFYGADAASRIAAANKKYEELGKILSTEVIPMVAGARVARIPVVSTVKEASKQLRDITLRNKGLKAFLKAEEAAVVFKPVPRQKVVSKQPLYQPQIEKIKARQTRQILERQHITEVRSVPQIKKVAVDMSKLRLKNTQTLNELLKTPAGQKVTAGKKYRQKSGLATTLREKMSARPRRGARPAQTFTEAQLDIEYMTEKQIANILTRQKLEVKNIYEQQSGLAKTLIQESKQDTQSLLKSLQKQTPMLVSIQKTKEIQVSKQISKQVSPQKYKDIVIQIEKQKLKSPQIEKIKEIYTQVPKPVTIQKQKLKEPPITTIRKPPEMPRRRQPREPKKPPEKKKIILTPNNFEDKLKKYAKGKKKRGKYVWNIRNPVPTLKSLTG